LPIEKWVEAENLWTRYYGEDIPDMVPGAYEVLNSLHQQGYGLGIVSSGMGMRVRHELDTCGVAELFEVVICGEDVHHPKPHPEGLETAMKSMDRAPEACCYVGDNPDDVEMGQRAQVRTIGIPSRYPGSEKLITLRPDLVLQSIRDLLQIFANS
jgi:HAD superfamily hydrolase (TIGR01509 family)